MCNFFANCVRVIIFVCTYNKFEFACRLTCYQLSLSLLGILTRQRSAIQIEMTGNEWVLSLLYEWKGVLSDLTLALRYLKCKTRMDEKNKFTSKILFSSPCAQHDLLSFESGLKCFLKGHTQKSSQRSKILTTSEAIKGLSSVLSPKKYGKSWGKNLRRSKLLKHNFLGF